MPTMLVMPGGELPVEDGGIALLTGLSDVIQILRGLLAAGDPGRVGTDVGAGLQKPGQLVDVGPQGVVTTGVRCESEQRIDVVGGSHTGWFGPARKLGGVNAGLVGTMGVDTDQLDCGRSDDRRPTRCWAICWVSPSCLAAV